MNLKESLFERLHRACLSAPVKEQAVDQLCRQGRMNPEVALFPNEAFYGGKLVSIGLPHQVDEILPADTLTEDKLNALITHRVAFLPSEPNKQGASVKVNYCEARLCAQLARKVFEQYQNTFNPSFTLGIITPYRSQIALIKKELCLMGIPQLNSILVDTVERFQGSERDVIIYSFCVNQPYQLRFLSNLMEEDGVAVDRKLNVALTRARKQMFIMGVPQLLALNPIYKKLLNFIKMKADFT